MRYNIIATRTIPLDDATSQLTIIYGDNQTMKLKLGLGTVIGILTINQKIDKDAEDKLQVLMNDIFNEKIPGFEGEIILKKEI